jgi:phycocyanobilin:ferredoxin oxidoreductase
MAAWRLMSEAAAEFRECLESVIPCMKLAPPALPASGANLDWENTLLESPLFRRAHVEYFAASGRCHVLHVCAVPQLHDPAPIFGFDMVAGPSRVTGIFLDLSPVVAEPATLRLAEIRALLPGYRFRSPRDLPEWGDIFSSDVLAIRPHDDTEILRALHFAHLTLDAWVNRDVVSGKPCQQISRGQDRYVAGQRRNEHTYRMLSHFIGPAEARRFIDETLFPERTQAIPFL